MAEILRTKQTGELTQTFLEFLLMQTQQALFALGKHPSRPPNSPPPNLQLGKMYVDHLVMLRWKTDGNLSAEELGALDNGITLLQGALTEAMKESAQ